MPQGWEVMPWYGMIFGPIMMIVVLASVIAIVVVLVRWLSGGYSSSHHNAYHQPPHRGRNSALDILEERYAKGDIDKSEFEEKKRVLSNR